MSSAPFSTPPAAAQTQPKPFTAKVPQEKIDEFKALLKVAKLGPVTFEGEQKDRKFGLSREWIQHAKDVWEKWDW